MSVLSTQTDTALVEKIIAEGLPVSFFAAPLAEEEFDLDDYAEMFAEWGWTGAEVDRPEWMASLEG